MGLVLADGFFPAPAAGALGAFGLGDHIGSGFGFGGGHEVKLGDVDQFPQGLGIGLSRLQCLGLGGDSDAGFEGFANEFS